MPPIAMITIFGSYVSKHYKTMLGIFIPVWVTTIRPLGVIVVWRGGATMAHGIFETNSSFRVK